MEDNQSIRIENFPPLPGPAVAIAINGKKKSKNLVAWALAKFASETNTQFKLLHVRPRVTSVPTPMGAAIPISEVRGDIAAAYKQEMEWHTNEMLHPYKKLCERKKVQVEVLVIESDDVVTSITEVIVGSRVNRLVIGASSLGFFSRKLDMSSIISTSVPSFCTIYVVSKGKLSSVRPSDSSTYGSIRDDNSVKSSSTSGSSGDTSVPHKDTAERASANQESLSFAPPATLGMSQALSTTNHAFIPMETSSMDTNHSGNMRLDADEKNEAGSSRSGPSVIRNQESWTSRWRDSEERKDAMSSCSSNADFGNAISHTASWRSMASDNHSRISNQASMSEVLTEYSSSGSQVNMNFELEKLRAELKNVQEMYAMAQNETMDASRKLDELNHRRLGEALKLDELRSKEVEAKELTMREKEKYEDARKEVENVRERAEKEALRRKEAERKAARDGKEKEKLQVTLACPAVQYQHFTWEEIRTSTSSFSEDLKIGMGSFGTVYKCTLHHTTAAVKVLHSEENQISKQFDRELEILSKIRHPHLLLLLGACPERGCLVYEYMENGNLEERLLQVNNTPAIPWFERYRIAWEVASVLVFLHKSTPKPIIHRDLKPANILLDHNFVSKVGDVGLSTMVQVDPTSKFTMYKDTSPCGTLCYIDPEYQRTGLISAKSDIYSFGMIILQLLTAKPAIALAYTAEIAVEEGNLVGILDPKAGSWPVEETQELAALGLRCTELRGKDRPDLKTEILPALEKLKKIADKARNSVSRGLAAPSSHFICPLLKDVMNEPCVAADGYTYDRQAIEEWLKSNDTSPMTHTLLPTKNLLPNYTLFSAITEWKSRKQ